MSFEDDIPVRANGQRVEASWWNDIRTALINNSVINTVLTGFSVGADLAIIATDTVLEAFEKTQGQINAIKSDLSSLISNFASDVRSTLLTGFVVGSNTAISATDTVLSAFEKLQGQLNALTVDILNTVLTGLTFPYYTAITASDTVLQAFGKLQGQINVWTELITTGDLTNNSNTTLVNIPELSLSVVNGRRYLIEYTIMYQSAATATGIAMTLNTPDSAAGTFALQCNFQVVGDATNATYTGTINSLGDLVVSSGVETANANFIANIKGIFVCTATGTISPRFRSEVNAQQVTVKAYSTVISREFQ